MHFDSLHQIFFSCKFKFSDKGFCMHQRVIILISFFASHSLSHPWPENFCPFLQTFVDFLFGPFSSQTWGVQEKKISLIKITEKTWKKFKRNPTLNPQLKYLPSVCDKGKFCAQNYPLWVGEKNKEQWTFHFVTISWDV